MTYTLVCTRSWTPEYATPYTIPSIPYTQHSKLCTLHLTPYTLHPTTYTLHFTLYPLHLTPYTLQPTPNTLHLSPNTLYTLQPTSYTLHPTSYTQCPIIYNLQLQPTKLDALNHALHILRLHITHVCKLHFSLQPECLFSTSETSETGLVIKEGSWVGRFRGPKDFQSKNVFWSQDCQYFVGQKYVLLSKMMSGLQVSLK